MKAVVYAADDQGCGHHRLIYPSTLLRQAGHDVEIIRGSDRHLSIAFQNDEVVHIDLPEGVDLFVFQRPTDWRLTKAIKYLRQRGITVVVDVDDDLSAIHPSNPAWTMLDPNRAKHEVQTALRNGLKPEHADRVYAQLREQYPHSWNNVIESCKYASLVTVSTPALLRRYAAHGRGVVLNNYAPDHYFRTEHVDSNVISWPAALHSHPNDPAAVGNALARLVADGASFLCIGGEIWQQGDATVPTVRYLDAIRKAFAISGEIEWTTDVSLSDWPAFLAQRIGIGIAPLADTLFNRGKSALKLIEMSACGVPWVASPRAEYTKLHKHGVGLVAEQPRDWYRKVKQLIDEPALRQDLGAAGREVVREKFLLSDNVWRWAEAWEQAWRLDHKDSPNMQTVIDTGHIVNGLPVQMMSREPTSPAK